MSNQLYMPRTNPIPFYEITQVILPQYHSRPFEDFPFRDTIKDWELPACYLQKYEITDPCPLQYIANFTNGLYDIIDRYGRIYSTFATSTKLQSEDNPGFWAQEVNINFLNLNEGVYFIRLSVLGVPLLISEPISIKSYHADTILGEFFNDQFHNDIIFETGIILRLRVEGGFGRVLPGVAEQYFTDQKQDQFLLSAKTFTKKELNIGGNRGIPDWMVDKINLMWSCNNVMIDGVLYAKSSEGELEFISEDEYPLRAITMVVEPGINRTSKIVNPDINTNIRMAVSYNLSKSALFGALGDDQTITITAFE